MNLYRWSGKKEEKENRNHCPRFERETYTLVFPYIFHGKLEAMIRSRATCLTSSTLSPNSKDFTSALNKLWNVPPPRSLASFFCSPSSLHSTPHAWTLYSSFVREKTRRAIRLETDLWSIRSYFSFFLSRKKNRWKFEYERGKRKLKFD